MRWLVQLQPVEQPRLGEPSYTALKWTVRPYLALKSGERSYLSAPVPFPRLTAAHAHARRECTRHEERRKASTLEQVRS